MKERTDGRSAYPAHLRGGMSLRDYFAAQALTGVWSLALAHLTETGETAAVQPPRIAAMCYEIADAMLEKRKNETVEKPS